MNSRSRFLITAAVVCHLLVAPHLVTSQLLSASAETGSAGLPATPTPTQGEEVTIRALQQEKDGPIFKLHGEVEIRYRTYVLYADDITYNTETGEATADGHVVLDGGPNDEHVQASHAVYNIRSESGSFDNVVGTAGIRLRGRRSVITSPNPFAFSGKKVVK